MRIVALVKQVPHPPAIEFDEETKALRREGVPLVLNPFDSSAVAAAASLRDIAGGEVVALTMGPPQAEEALRECLALGADRCVHLSDPLFALADTIGTSRTLALALAKLGADLVLCGRKTIDSETWQVPPEVAAYLDVPCVTNATAIEVVGGRGLRATRQTDTGEDVYEVDLPAVVSVARPQLEPTAHVADADARIERWDSRELVPDPRPDDKRFGQTGSPTRVLSVRDARPERAGRRAQTPSEARAIVQELLSTRKAQPSAWEKPEHVAEQPGRRYDSWTAVETVGGGATRLSLELVGKGRELAGALGGTNAAVVLGHGLAGVDAELIRYGAERVVLVDDATLAQYHTETWAAALRQVVERHRPHTLVFPASSWGRDLAPRVAGELELGMTGDCVDLAIVKAGRLFQRKPAYGGNIVSGIMGRTNPQLATVRARMFEPVEPREDATGEVERFSLAGLPEPRTRLVERRDGGGGHALDAADAVICVGSPLVGEIGEIEALVGTRAAVGGTHEVCAAGHLPPAREIGLYGRPVAPRLLLALGVADEFWNVTGWVRADVVLAVSSPIAADVSVDADWRDIVETVLA